MAYVVFPLSNIAWDVLGLALYRNWIDLAYLGALVVALILGGVPSATQRPRISRYVLLVLVMAIGGLHSLQATSPSTTVLMEMKPAFYLATVLVLLRFGEAPDRDDFCRFGRLLALILIAEFLIRSLLTLQVSRPVGSGEVNYDGALLCLSLLSSAADVRTMRLYGAVIFAGILASFSRTSLAGAILILLVAQAVPFRLKMLATGLAVLAALTSFLIRDLEVSSVESMDRFWMWSTAIDFIDEQPGQTALSFKPGSAIEVDVPPFLLDLWKGQEEALDLDGVYPFHFHAMWLRIAMSWGWLVSAIFALWLAAILRMRLPGALALGGWLAVLLLGSTMGLLYLGNVAVPWFLYLLSPRGTSNYSNV